MSPPHRVLPAAEGPAAFFWTSGADRVLRLLRCSCCRYFIHPPAPYCPRCGAREATPEAARGTGTVYSFTVNHQPWDGDTEHYVIAVVELDDQPGLRLVTNIVGVADSDVRVDMPVEVIFEQRGDIYLPLFHPVTS